MWIGAGLTKIYWGCIRYRHIIFCISYKHNLDCGVWSILDYQLYLNSFTSLLTRLQACLKPIFVLTYPEDLVHNPETLPTVTLSTLYCSKKRLVPSFSWLSGTKWDLNIPTELGYIDIFSLLTTPLELFLKTAPWQDPVLLPLFLLSDIQQLSLTNCRNYCYPTCFPVIHHCPLPTIFQTKDDFYSIRKKLENYLLPAHWIQSFHFAPDHFPFITTIIITTINDYIKSGHVPIAFQKARVILIQTKPNLILSDTSTYWLESRLSLFFLKSLNILSTIYCLLLTKQSPGS